MTNHVAKDCRSSEEKKKKYKESLKKRQAQELEEPFRDRGSEGFGHLCQVSEDSAKAREDPTKREIEFNVDSGASKTVVNGKNRAARGYKIHNDAQTGVSYRTAGTQQIKDEGKRVLQTKPNPGEKPWRINTRVANVRNNLLSPSEMAKCGHDILLRNEDGYAIHRETGKTHKFERTSGGWKFRTTLEAPAEANRVWEMHRLAELSPPKVDESWEW